MSNIGYAVESCFEKEYRVDDRKEMEDIIVMERLYLYNRSLPCGASVLYKRLKQCGVINVPSPRTIHRILHKHCVTNGRTGYCPEDYLQHERKQI